MNVTVRLGDSLWAYSELFKLPVELIADSNPHIAPQSLFVGQTIVIPGYTTRNYTIASGDTLWSIAASAGVPIDALRLLNPGLLDNSLQVARIIQIPVKVRNRVVLDPKSYNYADLLSDLQALVRLYPFIRQGSIGLTVMGKSLPEIRVGRGSRQIHANGSFHGNEWITTPALIAFLNDYLIALTNEGELRGIAVKPLYNTIMLSIVPMVNPDGVDLVVNGLPDAEPYRSEVLAINGGSTDFNGWKANIRGVDLNNQFPALWAEEAARGPRTPAPRDYAGTAPLTEPESIAMAELLRNRNFEQVQAYHTQGEVIYWGFQGLQPPETERLAAKYGDVSGYVPIETADSSAGFKDWFIQDWRRPGFTIEGGRGNNPLPITQLASITDAATAILLAAMTS